jgi:hypothetical protein
VSLKDIQFFYMEESGDLRSSSVCEEMRLALRRAVSYFQDISRSRVQKVQFNSPLRSGSNDLVELTQ